MAHHGSGSWAITSCHHGINAARIGAETRGQKNATTRPAASAKFWQLCGIISPRRIFKFLSTPDSSPVHSESTSAPWSKLPRFSRTVPGTLEAQSRACTQGSPASQRGSRAGPRRACLGRSTREDFAARFRGARARRSRHRRKSAPPPSRGPQREPQRPYMHAVRTVSHHSTRRWPGEAAPARVAGLTGALLPARGGPRGTGGRSC